MIIRVGDNTTVTQTEELEMRDNPADLLLTVTDEVNLMELLNMTNILIMDTHHLDHQDSLRTINTVAGLDLSLVIVNTVKLVTNLIIIISLKININNTRKSLRDTDPDTGVM